MIQFRTPFTSMDEENPVVEINTGISETVPDQTLTVRDILTRFSNGTLEDIVNNNMDFSEDMPDLRGLDIVELQQMKIDAQMDIDEINAMIEMHEQVNDPTPTPPKKGKKKDPSPTDPDEPLNTDE